MKNLTLPQTLIISSFIICVFLTAIQIQKHWSIQKQQEISIEEKRKEQNYKICRELYEGIEKKEIAYNLLSVYYNLKKNECVAVYNKQGALEWTLLKELDLSSI